MIAWPALPTSVIAALTFCAAVLLYYFARAHGDEVATLARSHLALATTGLPYVLAFVVLYAFPTGPAPRLAARVQVAGVALMLVAVDDFTSRVAAGRPAARVRLKWSLALAFALVALFSPLAIGDPARAYPFPTYLQKRGIYRVGPLASLSLLSFLVLPWLALSRCMRRSAPRAARAVGRGLLACALLGALDVLAARTLRAPVYLGPLGFLVLIAGVFRTVLARVDEHAREREQLHAALVAKTREVDSANAALLDAERLSFLGRLAAAISHEINNPAGFILANLAQLRERLGNADEVTARALDDSIAGVRRIRDIVSALRVLAQGPQETPEPARLERVAEMALLLAGPSIKHGIEVVRSLSPAPPTVARQGELMQALLDLIGDAVDSLSGDGPATVTVATRSAKGMAELEVRAQGPRAPRRRDPFTADVRLESVRRLARSLGGTLVVRDAADGTTARLLRLRPAPADLSEPSPEVHATAPPRSDTRSRRARVLIIDDEPAMLRVLGRVVGRAYECMLAGNADAALEAVGTHPDGIDLVLCDVIMADANGVDLYEELVRASPRLAGRVTFMTGGGLPRALTERIKGLGCPVLEKPIETSDLLEHIAQRLSREAPFALPSPSGGTSS